MIIHRNTINPFLKELYFDSIHKHAGITYTDELETLSNQVILVEGERLTPELILRLKNQGNKLVVFDINDNSIFTYTYSHSPATLEIDLMFKVAGIQKTNFSYDTYVNSEMGFSKVLLQFLNEERWSFYETLKKTNRIHSLPYVPYSHFNVDLTPWEDKNKLALVRGGHHYSRFLIFLQLLRINFIDRNSVFNAIDYRGTFCPDCKKAIEEQGKITFDYVRNHKMRCKVSDVSGSIFDRRGDWNNSDIPKFMQMGDIFNKKNPIDLSMFEDAFCSSFMAENYFHQLISRYILFADLKWVFSIYVPPRFWQAAQAHTVNLVGSRINDQDYFPEIKEGDHYLSYSEDFSDLESFKNVTKEQSDHIAQNCFSLYKHWIYPDRYKISTNLINHIVEKINEIR